MSRTQELAIKYGMQKLFSGYNSFYDIHYEVWGKDGFAFVIDDDQVDHQMDGVAGLFTADEAIQFVSERCNK